MGLRPFSEVPNQDDNPAGAPDLSDDAQLARVQQALDGAMSTLLKAAEAALIEEHEDGQPGKKWQAFMMLVSLFTGISPDNKVQTTLVARFVFQLLRARQMLTGQEIDPTEYDFDGPSGVS